MSIIPTPHTVAHMSRQVDKTGSKDSHGNYQLATAEPVIRKAQCFVQLRYGTSRILSTETTTREQETLHMAVPNPDVYKSGDRVLLWGTVSGGEYVGGYAYWVDGDPEDSRRGPWTALVQQFGGYVKLRRVT